MFMSHLGLLLTDESGQDLIEYALIAGFMAVLAGAVFPILVTSITSVFHSISDALSAAAGSPDGS